MTWLPELALWLQPLLVCGLLATAIWAIRAVAVSIREVLRTADLAINGFAGPLRAAAQDLADAAENAEDITAAVEEKAKGGLGAWIKEALLGKK